MKVYKILHFVAFFFNIDFSILFNTIIFTTVKEYKNKLIKLIFMNLKYKALDLFCFLSIMAPTAIGFAQNISPDSTQISEKEIDDVVVIGKGVIDVVKERETPIAVSIIKKQEIRDKGGNQEFPALMKNAPSIYVNDATGYGDSKMITRGFNQSNTAVLINGQPVNGMESGSVYWTNWTGLIDIANTIQVQRGLGSSKLAISSVGGTINIVTKATDKKAGSTARFLTGNDGFWRTTYEYNSGLQGKWGVSFSTSTWRGDGYNRGTKGYGQNYFLSIGFQPNEKHNFNFIIFGAPQNHDQNYYTKISDFKRYGYRYNVNQGWLHGKELLLRTNYYHKSVANLNWDWKINEKSTLSTVFYGSLGRGGGTGGYGSKYIESQNISTPQSPNAIPGSRNQENGTISWDAIFDYNSTHNTDGIGTGSDNFIIRSSVNNHQWYGLVSNFNHKFKKHFEFNVGIDGRAYTGTHFQQANNFLGLSGITDNISTNVNGTHTATKNYNINPWSSLFRNVSRGQRLSFDYDETIQYIGAFGQFEYVNHFMSAFIQGVISEQYNSRKDRFNYTPNHQKSKTLNNTGYNIKGGVNFKINENHNIFGNAGYYSRQPFQNNLFLNWKNDVNPLADNEEIIGFEIGYELHYNFLDLSINLYRTSWNNRVETISNESINQIENRSGIDELHQGIEVEFLAKPIRKLHFKGHLSLGNWKYNGNAHSTTYDSNNLSNILSEKDILLDDVKTSNAPQFSYGVGLVYKAFKNFTFDADLNRYEKLYSDFDVTRAATNTKIDLIELPDYFTLDMGASYTIYFDKASLRFRANVNNALNDVFMTYSKTNIKSGDKGAENVKFKGIDTANQVYFGNGRTWNFGVTYNF